MITIITFRRSAKMSVRVLKIWLDGWSLFSGGSVNVVSYFQLLSSPTSASAAHQLLCHSVWCWCLLLSAVPGLVTRTSVSEWGSLGMRAWHALTQQFLLPNGPLAVSSSSSSRLSSLLLTTIEMLIELNTDLIHSTHAALNLSSFAVHNFSVIRCCFLLFAMYSSRWCKCFCVKSAPEQLSWGSSSFVHFLSF